MKDKTHKFQIAPSLLAADWMCLGNEIQALEKAGVDLFHLDIMDGKFVPNITFGFPIIQQIRETTKLPLDAHLMIENADAFLEEFARVGCNWVSVHVEACPHINRTLNRIKVLGMKAGVAINPGTSLASLDAVLDDAEYCLIMSVNPGFGGQQFIPASLDRVRELRNKIGRRPVKIQIDGGIKQNNIHDVVSAGADIIVIGTGLLSAKDYAKAVKELRMVGGTSHDADRWQQPDTRKIPSHR